MDSAALLRVAAGVSGIARAVAGGRRCAGGPFPPCAWHRCDGWVDAGDDDAERPGVHRPAALAAGTVETAAYVLVHTAAAVRVFVPLAEPGAAALAAGISSLLCTVAFAIFLAAYWPAPHVPARGRTADTEGTCQQDRRITAGLYRQRCPAQRYRRAAAELKTFMLRSPPPSLVPDPDLSWDRKRGAAH